MTDAHLPTRRPFQFRLRTLLVITTVTAIVMSGLFSRSDNLRTFATMMLALSLPVVATVGVVYSKGYRRTFLIGALFPVSLQLMNMIGGGQRQLWVALMEFLTNPRDRQPPDDFSVPFEALSVILTSIAMGLLAMATRWLLESGQREERPTPLEEKSDGLSPDDDEPRP